MTTRILDAGATDDALAAFLALPASVYAGDTYWCPGDPAAERASLLRPDLAARQRILVALQDDVPAARLCARVSPTLTGSDGRPLGLLGFFEARAGTEEATGELFTAAVARLRAAGAGEIVGPMDGDSWHRYRLAAGPFDERPFLLEPYNPPGYPALWEAQGFVVLASYLSQRIDDLPALRARFATVAGPGAAAGYRLRPLDRRRFDRELDLLYDLSRAIFAGAFLYTEISRQDFRALYAGARPLIDPDLVAFAETADGEPVGFLFALPDRFAAVQAWRRGGPLAWFHAARRWRTRTLNVKTLGVLPEHRRSGVALALLHRVYSAAIEKGYRRANHCLIRGENPSERLDYGLGRLLRRYHLYRLAAPA